MSKEDTADLMKFFASYPEPVRQLATWMREFVWNTFPDANELIYDNYNALAIGWSITDRLSHTICSIALFTNYLHFGFYWGSQIKDPKKLLLGKGTQYRYIIVKDRNDFPKAYVKQLLKEAYANCLAKLKDGQEFPTSATIIKCSLPVKKRPGLLIPKKQTSKKIKSNS